MRALGIALLAVVAALLVACSGNAPNALTPSSGADAPSARRHKGTIEIVVKFPPHKKRRHGHNPRFISASTMSLVFSLTSIDGHATSAVPPLTINDVPSQCTPSGAPPTYTCTGNWAVPAGVDAFSLGAYDQLSGGGNLLSTNVLTTSIKPGPNVLSTTLFGIPASFTIAPASATYVSGTQGAGFTILGAPTPFPFNVTMKDVDGNTIVGPGIPTVEASPSNANFAVSGQTTSGFSLAPIASANTVSSTVTVYASMPPGVAPCTPGCSTTVNAQTELPSKLAVTDNTNASVHVYAAAQVALALAGNTNVPESGELTGANTPKDVVFDTAGDMFVSASTNRVFCYSKTQVASALAGTSSGPAAHIVVASTPIGMAFDASGNLWIVETNAAKVVVATSSTATSCAAGTNGVLAPGSLATDTTPTSLVFDSLGDLWVAVNSVTGVIDSYSAAGVASALPPPAGTNASAVAFSRQLTTGNFTGPSSTQNLAFDLNVPSGCNTPTTFTCNLFGPASATVTNMFASPTATGSTPLAATTHLTDAAASKPTDVVADASGNLFVSDNGKDTVSVYTAAQAGAGTAQTPKATLATGAAPEVLVADAALGTLYVGATGAAAKTVDVYWSATLTAALSGTAGTFTGTLQTGPVPGVPKGMRIITP